jgi:hypothetical protein
MDLVERYLNAVRFWLPKAQKQDIISELSEDIRSQVEEREAALGRTLAAADLEAILKEKGSPYSVAGRFLPQRQLIGPALFPMYVFVLKIVALFYAIPWLLVWCALILFVPSYRAAHPGLALFGTLGSLWTSMLTTFAVITVGFAVGEESQRRSALRHAWDPKRLPAVRDVLKIPRFGSAAEIVVDLLFLAWWLGGLPFPLAFRTGGAPAAFGPVPLWADFRAQTWAPIALTIVAAAALSAFALVRPYWTRIRLAVRVAIDLFVAGLILSFLGPRATEISALWTSVVDPPAGAASAAGIPAWLGLSTALTLGIVALICVAVSVRNLIRIARYETLRARRPSASKSA